MNLRWRIATSSDSDFVLCLRNEENTRNNSIEGGVISWDEHNEWFTSRLGRVEFEPIMVFLIDDVCIGITRLDLINLYPRSYRINLAVSLDHRGRGLGLRILLKTCSFAQESFMAKEIHAMVKQINTASLSIFRKAEFEEVASENDLVQFVKHLI